MSPLAAGFIQLTVSFRPLNLNRFTPNLPETFGSSPKINSSPFLIPSPSGSASNAPFGSEALPQCFFFHASNELSCPYLESKYLIDFRDFGIGKRSVVNQNFGNIDVELKSNPNFSEGDSVSTLTGAKGGSVSEEFNIIGSCFSGDKRKDR